MVAPEVQSPSDLPVRLQNLEDLETLVDPRQIHLAADRSFPRQIDCAENHPACRPGREALWTGFENDAINPVTLRLRQL